MWGYPLPKIDKKILPGPIRSFTVKENHICQTVNETDSRHPVTFIVIIQIDKILPPL